MKNSNEIKIIDDSLNELIKNGYINEKDLNILKDYYYKDERNIKEINTEISKFPIDKEKLKQKLDSIIRSDKNITKESNEVKPKLMLDNITDFRKDEKDYIKIHYPMPLDSVVILENTTDPFKSAKEIFEELNEKYGNDVDGIDRTTKIFEDMLLSKCSEIKLTPEEEQKKYSEYDKLTIEQKASFNGLEQVINNNKKRFEDKKISVNMEEKLIIISKPGTIEKDEIKKIEFNKELNRYELVPLDAKGYKYDNESNLEQETEEQTYDKSEEQEDPNEEYELQNKENQDEIDKGISFKKKKPRSIWQRNN